MNSTVEISENVATYGKTIVIRLDSTDFISIKSSKEQENFIMIAKDNYEKSKKLSDLLWYLSEKFKVLEDTE